MCNDAKRLQIIEISFAFDKKSSRENISNFTGLHPRNLAYEMASLVPNLLTAFLCPANSRV